MYRPAPATALVATLAILLSTAYVAAAGSADSLAKARELLDQKDGRAAVEVLEMSLPGDEADRPELLGLLRRAYSEAAQQATAEGNADEAELYRDNLEILNRKATGTPAASQPSLESKPAIDAGESPEAPSVPPPAAPTSPTSEDAMPPDLGPPREVPKAAPPVAAPGAAPAGPAEREAPTDSLIRPISLPSDEAPAPSPKPTPAPSPVAEPPAEPTISVATADLAFVEKRYNEAGQMYAALAAGKQLPKDRCDHWAYCRSVEVARRINAKPKSAKEWESIHAEIRQIQALSPKNWFGDYLGSKAAEKAGTRPAARSNKVVVRGSAPEESPTPTAAEPRPQKSAATNATRAASNTGQGFSGNWQVVQTANFRVFHADAATLANRVAQAAEATRDLQTRRWGGAASKMAWTPRCDVYLFPNAAAFSRMTGQPEDSPGFSTMGMNSGKIVTRRVNLRADHNNMISAILPHEVTHVILADLFPHQQIPRWADEGMAVLSEPNSEQGLRASDLDKPLAAGQLFKLSDLMAMDYPDGKFWSLYYAQSVSLTRFLVEQGSPEQFIKFVQGSQHNGVESELRRIYQIEGCEDLEKRWLDYARSKSSSELTSGTGTVALPVDEAVRR